MITIARASAARTALTLAGFAFEFDASGVSALNRAGMAEVPSRPAMVTPAHASLKWNRPA